MGQRTTGKTRTTGKQDNGQKDNWTAEQMNKAEVCDIGQISHEIYNYKLSFSWSKSFQ